MEYYDRRIKKSRYVIAGIFTAMIFIVGLLVGFVIEGKRVQSIEGYSQELRLDIASLQLQYDFIDQLAQAGNCDAFSKSFDKNLDKLEETRLKLVGYGASATVNKAEFDMLRRDYILSQVQYWFLSIKAKRLCKTDVVNVLYFFSKECDTCDDQSFLLTFLKQKFGDRLFIFGFDSSFDKEPLLNLMGSTYNVTMFPTIIIENSTFTEFIPMANLTESICALYDSPPKACTE